MKRLLACLVAAFIVVGLTVPVAAAAARPAKVVIVVGPTGPGMTDRFRAQGDEAARIARRYTPDVVKVYSPNATWPAVRKALQGASVVIYMGHGNGWPSKYRDSLFPPTQNGFGLNPTAGSGDSSHQYFGEALVGSQVKLAKNAVVLLHHLCYASGNTEPGLPEGTVAQARRRVDNYAAGFIKAGAAAVAADAWSSPAYMLQSVLAGRRSIDRIWRNAPSVNGNFTAFRSDRSPGYIAQMDPATPSSGFRRSIVLKAGLASKDVLAGGRGNAAASIVAEPDVPAAPTLLGRGMTLSGPRVRGVPSAGAETNVRLPFEVKDRSKLPDEIQASVRWDPIDVTVVPLDPANEVEEPAEPAEPTATPEVTATPDAESTPVEERAEAPVPEVAVDPTPEPEAEATVGPASPTPASNEPSANPTASAEPSPSATPEASPEASDVPDASASIPPTQPSATPDASASPETDLGVPGEDDTVRKPWRGQPEPIPAHEPPVPGEAPSDFGLVKPESIGDVVQPVEGLYQKTGILFPVKLPTAPGLYRLSVTLHDDEGIAYDAETQALVSPMLVRIVGDFEARILATEATTLEAGTSVPLPVRVANLGKATWGQEAVVDHGRRGGGEAAAAASIVGHWVALDQPATADLPADVRSSLPPALEPGTRLEALLDLTVPTEPGQYLLVLDLVTPESGSLAALGVQPTLVRVTVLPAP